MSEEELERLRREIRAVDRDMVRLAARRTELARRAGELKRAVGQPIRNYAVEAEVIRLAREAAHAEGLRPGVAEDVVKLLIQESLRVQEKDRLGRASRGRAAGRALVVGGAGNMGAWFVEFLESKGYAVAIADTRGSLGGRPLVADVAAEARGFDLVLVATPPSVAGGVLRSLRGRTDALVFDIASLKAPVLKDLQDLVAAGMRASSLHPMWGPSADLLANKNVVVCSVGNPEADRALRGLFEDTAANVVELPAAEHDRHMASTLGVPHALNLAFGHAIARGGTPFPVLDRLGGPTFRKQSAVAREVASENKDLYHEIQVLNPHTPEALEGLRRSLDELEASLADRTAFRAYMARAERFFQGDAR